MTDYATDAAKEIRSHIREFGANAGMSAHSLGVITDIIHRHRSARERELEAGVQRLLDAIFACQKDRDGGYDALASAWWDVVCETAEEIRRSRK